MATNHANFYNIGSMLLGPSATGTLQIDTREFNELQVVAEQLFSATASATGLTCYITDGVGAPDVTNTIFFINTSPSPTIHYDSAWTVQTMNAPVVSSGAQTVDTRVNLDLTSKGEWIKMTFINKDSTNTCTLSLYADAS